MVEDWQVRRMEAAMGQGRVGRGDGGDCGVVVGEEGWKQEALLGSEQQAWEMGASGHF